MSRKVFRSVSRALRRGHLKIEVKESKIPNYVTDPITGIMSVRGITIGKTSVLMRRVSTNNKKWVDYA